MNRQEAIEAAIHCARESDETGFYPDYTAIKKLALAQNALAWAKIAELLPEAQVPSTKGDWGSTGQIYAPGTK